MILELFNENNSYDKVELWGRIRGIHGDYYIISGLKYTRNTSFPTKEFFWAYDDFKFAPLPKTCNKTLPFLSKINTYFHGVHDTVLRCSQGTNVAIEDFDPENDERNFQKFDCLDIIQKGNQEAALTELDRLSVVVREIERSCAIVPADSMKNTPNGETIENIGFRGIKLGSEGCASWKHFRGVHENERIKRSVQKEGELNYLDELENDIPRGAWSVKKDSSGLKLFVTNKFWEGFLAYARCNSPVYGYIYFGDGRSSNDFVFTH